MGKFIRIIGVLILCLAFVLTCTPGVLAYIECDGLINLYEWDGVEKIILFSRNDHSGCVYSSACARVKFIEEDRRVYFALTLSNEKDFPEDAYCEVNISFNGSSEIVLGSDGISVYDENEFDVEYGYTSDSFGGGNFEADIALKDTDYSEKLIMNISVGDYEGKVSQDYNVVIKSVELMESESISIRESEKQSEKEAKKSEKTTKKRTTKKSTTKAKKSRTTKRKTTTEEKTQYITEKVTFDYETFSEKQNKNTRSILLVGIVCAVTSVIAMCVSISKKDKSGKDK